MFRLSNIALPLVAALLSLASLCQGADKVWTGAGTTRHISEGANWQDGIAPSNGDRLFFPAVAQEHVENDLVGATFDSLFFSGDGNVYGLYGNPMTLTGTPASPAYVSAQGRSTYFIILDVAFATQNVAIVTDGLPTGTREPGIQFSQGRITFAGGDIGVSAPVGSIEFVGDILETAQTSFTIDGVDVSFSGNNSFTGLVRSSSNSFAVDSANALGTSSLGTVMTGQSILDLMNADTSEMVVAESFVLASEFTSPYWGTIVGGGLGPVRVTGNMELQKDQVFMPASAPFVIDGVISGPGHLEVGRGFEQAVVLNNPSNSFTGGLSVTQGVLRAGNSLAFGQFNDLAVTAGTTLDIGETFQAISNFSCAGTMNAAVRTGELFVRGSIALSNCVLNTSNPGGYIPQSQEVMTMVENVTGAPFGEFVGYPEGTAINVNGVHARATYHAGTSGNNFAFVAEIIPVSNVSARTPPQSVVDGAVASAFVALGLDQWNRAAPNARVTFTVPVGCGSFSGSQSAQAFTDAQGIATAPPFAASGVSQVCFVTAQGDAGGSATFEVHSYAPAEVTMATIPTVLNTIVNQPFTLAAELRGANGMSLPGLAVTFQVVMRGNASGPGNAGANLPPSAVTGTDSRATVTGIANNKSGNYDITVRWGTLSRTVPVSQKAQ